MIISDQSVVLSLTIGVVLGAIFSINKAIVVVFDVKKTICFLLDFTFAVICLVLTFLGALSISFGYLRLLQVLLELIAALSFYYVFSQPITAVMKFIFKNFQNIFEKIILIIKKIINKIKLILKNVKKLQIIRKKCKKN